MEHLPKVTHKGELHFGDISIPCAVLDDGRRVITEHGITTAIGSRGGYSKIIKKKLLQSEKPLPVFLASPRLLPFISEETINTDLKEISYKDGRRIIKAYEANALPVICDIWLQARESGVLHKTQLNRALKAEILMRSLAKIGIVALVDEATGYQAERERNELHQLLAKYLSEERLAWAKRFPDIFYRQIFRLKKWQWTGTKNRSPYLGKITNDIVYDRLPQGVLPKLRELNPVSAETKRRKYRHHQFLSEDLGQPDLQNHLIQIISLMKASQTWGEFMRLLNRAFPTKGNQDELDLDTDM